jgi:acetolactate synthase I/II/III large subunit
VKNIDDGGEAILQAFRSLNIDYVISSPGSEWPSLWEALARQKQRGTPGPRYLDCGHESIAVGMATGYTHVTGRMQAVLLHAGAGLLQGAMAIGGAQATEIPMLVMSGETLGYGEADFDPGAQWYRNLSVVGGPQRLLEPVVKWALQSPSVETLYQSVVRAGEVAQRTPRGPTYVCASMEAMLAQWAKPESLGAVPAAPKLRPSSADIERVADLLATARCPAIVVESADPDQATFDHLVTLADLLAMPVVESPAATSACFPKSHELFVGQDISALRDEIDVALLVECRAPWYPPSNAPRNTTIVAVGANPLKTTMVHQVMAAGHYLEGDLGLTLELLIEAVRKRRPDPAAVAQRRERWTAEHRKWRARLDAAERAAAAAETITVPLVAKLLREKMPADTICVDETIVHARVVREHTLWDDPFGFFRAPSGLGQGLGYALGVKLALPKRPVVVTIGDGTFMYNPVVPALSFADAHAMPLLILICNNAKYAAMQYFHDKFYPDSTASAAQDYYGVNIPDAHYERAAAIVGGYGKRVETPAELSAALDEAIATLTAGKTAIINMIMPGKLR